MDPDIVKHLMEIKGICSTNSNEIKAVKENIHKFRGEYEDGKRRSIEDRNSMKDDITALKQQANRWKWGIGGIIALGAFAGWMLGVWKDIRALFPHI